MGHDCGEQVEHDESLTVGHDRTESIGNDEQVSIGRDRRHAIGQDDFLNIGRNQRITTGKDRTEEVGNHRRDKTAANHWLEIGGDLQQSVQGRVDLEAGQAIGQRSPVIDLQAGQKICLRGPGGSITLDDRGITLAGVAIHVQAPMFQKPQGSAFASEAPGISANGHPFDSPCMKRTDGTCPQADCPCGNYQGADHA